MLQQSGDGKSLGWALVRSVEDSEGLQPSH